MSDVARSKETIHGDRWEFTVSLKMETYGYFFFFLMKRVGQFRNCSLNEEIKIHDDINRARESKGKILLLKLLKFFFFFFFYILGHSTY